MQVSPWRWLWDRLLWRRKHKMPKCGRFSLRCSNQRAESFSYALGKRPWSVSLWTGGCEETIRPAISRSHPQWIRSPIPSQLKCLRPTSHGASASSVDASAIAFLGPCWLWMSGPQCSFQKLLHPLYLICMLLSLLWHPSLIRDFKMKCLWSIIDLNPFSEWLAYD